MNIIEHNKNGLVYLTADGFEAAGGVAHGFSTRLGGVSEGIYATLNLGMNRGDAPDRVRENYRRFCAAIGADMGNIVCASQVHGDTVRTVTAADLGIGLRAYGQNDPVVAYKKEGYEMFEQMIAAIQEETLRRLFLVRLRQNQEVRRERVAKVTGESGASDGTVQKQPQRKVIKIGRNDPCPCGSGLKWKKCTCKQFHPEVK